MFISPCVWKCTTLMKGLDIMKKWASTQMNIADEGFMAYYIGSSQYEILELSETRLHVRSYMPSDPILAWYLIFTTEKPVKE